MTNGGLLDEDEMTALVRELRASSDPAVRAAGDRLAEHFDLLGVDAAGAVLRLIAMPQWRTMTDVMQRHETNEERKIAAFEERNELVRSIIASPFGKAVGGGILLLLGALLSRAGIISPTWLTGEAFLFPGGPPPPAP